MSDLIKFYQKASTFESAIPIQSQWVLNIEANGGQRIPRSIYKGDVGVSFDGLEPEPWLFENAVDYIAEQSHIEDSTSSFCFLCQGVILPAEASNIEFANVSGTPHQGRGFIKGSYSSGRVIEYKLKTSFLETQQSFIDFIIKPWIIKASHQGLIDYPPNHEKNLKVNIGVFFLGDYSKNVDRSIVRKKYTFVGACPISVSESNHSYMGDEIKTYNVEWVFKHYKIQPTYFIGSNMKNRMEGTLRMNNQLIGLDEIKGSGIIPSFGLSTVGIPNPFG